MKFESDSNNLLKTYSKPLQKFLNFAIAFVLHQYLTTIFLKKFQKCPKPSSISSNTFYMDKKIQKFQKIQKSGQRVAAAPLLLSSTSPLLLLLNASGPAATMEQGRSKGARAQEWHSRGGLTLRGRRRLESGDEDGGLGAARGDGDGSLRPGGTR